MRNSAADFAPEIEHYAGVSAYYRQIVFAEPYLRGFGFKQRFGVFYVSVRQDDFRRGNIRYLLHFINFLSDANKSVAKSAIRASG